MNKNEIETYKNSFTQDKLEEIAKAYDSGQKVTDIIQEYNLDISSSQLPLFLPKKEVSDICPYCQVNMFTKRIRTERYDYTTKSECLKCGHIFVKDKFEGYVENKCKCNNCLNIANYKIHYKEKVVYNCYSSIIPYEKNGIQIYLLETNVCYIWFLLKSKSIIS